MVQNDRIPMDTASTVATKQLEVCVQKPSFSNAMRNVVWCGSRRSEKQVMDDEREQGVPFIFQIFYNEEED